MTDTLVDGRFDESEDDSQVRSYYKKTWNAIAEIDEKLDAGSEAAGKRKLTNELVENSRGEWEEATNDLIKQMRESDLSADKLAGIFYGIIRGLSSEFEDEAKTFIISQVEAAPKAEDTLSDEDKKALASERSELAKQINQIIEMAGVFGEYEEGSEWAKPKRRGAVGKRGKRALTFYDWSVDGVEVDEDDNSVKGVSVKLGFEKQADFTKALKDAEVDTTSPPDSFSVTINGHEVSATRVTDEELEEEVPTEPTSEEE
jgi:hypothetical protein